MRVTFALNKSYFDLPGMTKPVFIPFYSAQGVHYLASGHNPMDLYSEVIFLSSVKLTCRKAGYMIADLVR